MPQVPLSILLPRAVPLEELFPLWPCLLGKVLDSSVSERPAQSAASCPVDRCRGRNLEKLYEFLKNGSVEVRTNTGQKGLRNLQGAQVYVIIQHRSGYDFQ